MDLVLYHYVHCPYCVRVRMALGYLQLSYQSRVIDYDDQKTPTDLVGIKMLPILVYEGVPLRESLDIIKRIDRKNTLRNDLPISSAETFIKSANNLIHSLTMPQWIYTKEFTPSAREYFIKQKETKRGPFKELVAKSDDFIRELNPHFAELEKKLKPFFESDEITIQDIMIAAHLWGIYVVPEFQFPAKIHQYLQKIKSLTRFNYHQDYWS